EQTRAGAQCRWLSPGMPARATRIRPAGRRAGASHAGAARRRSTSAAAARPRAKATADASQATTGRGRRPPQITDLPATVRLTASQEARMSVHGGSPGEHPDRPRTGRTVRTPLLWRFREASCLRVFDNGHLPYVLAPRSPADRQQDLGSVVPLCAGGGASWGAWWLA